MARTLALAVGAAAAAFGAAGPACRMDRGPMHPQSAPGHWHVLAPGETIADVARRAGVPEEDLLEVNGIDDPARVRPGQSIFVLDTSGATAETAAAPPSAGSSVAPAVVVGGAAGPDGAGASRLRWPVDDPRVTSSFGRRWGRPHEGIDLVAPTGTPVLAAAAGEVIYAGNTVRGYGNMVVVRHGANLLTVYAHNSVLLVRPGDRVGVGQRLALSGQTGHATAPHLHFEVRLGEAPRDPLLFLPHRR